MSGTATSRMGQLHTRTACMITSSQSMLLFIPSSYTQYTTVSEARTKEASRHGLLHGRQEPDPSQICLPLVLTHV